MSQLQLLSVVRTEPMPVRWRPDAMPDLRGVAEVAVDFETTGLRWWEDDRPVGVALAWRRDGRVESAYLPFGHAGGNYHEPAVLKWFRDAIRGKRVVNLNTKFDVHMSRVWGADLREIASSLGDVGHYAALLDDHRRRFNLEILSQDYLGEGKVTGLDLSRGAQVYPGWMVTPYARQDAELVIRLMDRMAPELEAQGLGEVAALEDRVLPATVEMEANGCPIDMEKLEAWEKSTRRELDVVLQALARGAGHAVNPKSGVDMARLFAERGWESDEVTESGAPSFSDRVMARFAAKDHVVKMAREAAHLSDLRSKYICAYLDAVGGDGIMRYGLHQLRNDDGGTVSGRYSSSAMTRDARSGVNVQQVMAVSKQKRLHGDKYLIRELYVPAPGQLLLAADAKQIEFRLFVHLSRSERLVKQYRDNPETDFHNMVGEIIHKVRPDFDRKRVKNVNFACVTADTPVLTSDLRWVEAGSLETGDGLLAFDEYQKPGVVGRGGARRWRVASVVGNALEERECAAIYLANGDVLTATLDHRWVVNQSHAKGKWVRTDELKCGDLMMRVLPVSGPDTSWEAGWLAGFLDGEGCASAGSLSVNQNEGPTLDFAETVFRDKYPRGLVRNGPNRDPRSTNTTAMLRTRGKVSDRMDLLVRVRPKRIMVNFVKGIVGTMFQSHESVRVERVERVGKKLIAALGTTEQTYIAGGYAAHNTLFGAGAAKEAEMMGISEQEAQKLMRVYDRLFPEARKLLKEASRVAESRGYVKTLMGRRTRFPDKKRLHKALNGAIQGGAADVNKVKVAELYEARKQLNLTLRMTVHDEVVGDVPDTEGARLVAKVLDQQSLALLVPILWDTKTGANWAVCA